MSNAAPSNNGGAISLAASPSRGAKRTSSGSQIKKPPVEATAWCYTGTKEDTNFSFAWTIENFGRKMEIYKNGECLTSDTFKVEVEGVETAWKLECFPNGKQKIGEDTAGAVSVFLYPANGSAINRQFSFAIGFVNEECSRVMKGKGDHCFRDNQNGWGWLKLVTHQTLRFANDKLLPNDCLNILCVMKFRGSEVTTSGTSRPTSCSLHKSLGTSEPSLDTEENENQGLLEVGKIQTFFICPLETCSFYTSKQGMKGGKAANHLKEVHKVSGEDMKAAGPGAFKFKKVKGEPKA